jgi:hypothetical protein
VSDEHGRGGDAARSARARVAAMPRGVRLLLLAAVVAAGFVVVVLPLFSGGGAPQAEVSGFLPGSAVAGRQVRADIAVDNVGDSIISPVCVAMSGDGARLVSVNFQGLDQIGASGNRACGGQLTAQETISITIVFILDRRGTTDVQVVPQQGGTVIGPGLSTTVTVS